MMTVINHEPLYGLIELDAYNTVLYYNPEKNGDAGGEKPAIVGQNFFTEVAKFDDVPAFQERIVGFRQSNAPANSFNFTFHCDEMSYPSRVLLARIHDRSEAGRRESIFVHIRKA